MVRVRSTRPGHTWAPDPREVTEDARLPAAPHPRGPCPSHRLLFQDAWPSARGAQLWAGSFLTHWVPWSADICRVPSMCWVLSQAQANKLDSDLLHEAQSPERRQAFIHACPQEGVPVTSEGSQGGLPGGGSGADTNWERAQGRVYMGEGTACAKAR